MPKRVANFPKVESMLQKAESFLFACKLIESHTPGRVVAGFAFVVNSAFAAELYLKVITILERKLRPLQTHNLLPLFEDLSEDARQELRERFERELLPGLQTPFANHKLPKGLTAPADFKDALRRSAFAFVDWRYGDNSGKPMHYHMIGLPFLARDRIYRLRPELRRSLNFRSEAAD